jgi:transposase-like protein
VRDLGGRELALPSWDRAVAEDWRGKWAMNLMLINVSTRKFRRAVRLPEGDVPAPAGAGISKSATSRHFVALSAARMKEWMGADLSGLDIMVVQIDGIHISEHLVRVAALGIDSAGFKHPLGLMEGATEHSAVVQALIDDLIERGLDPAVPRLFIIDGSKALAKAIRRSFGRHTPIQRCQIHKARNIMERLSPALHASVRRALRQAWELDDAVNAEKLIRNLAQRLERDAPGVSKSILEGLDEILTVSRLGPPAQLRRSLACTNIIENMMGTVRRVTRNVKRWSSSSMALRLTAAAMNDAARWSRSTWSGRGESNRLARPPWGLAYGARCGYGSRYTTAHGRTLRRRISRCPNQTYGRLTQSALAVTRHSRVCSATRAAAGRGCARDFLSPDMLRSEGTGRSKGSRLKSWVERPNALR